MKPPLPEFTEAEMILRALIQLIPSNVDVLVPFEEEELAKVFPVDMLRGRRDFNKLMDIVKTITFLYQNERQTITVNNEIYLLASLKDLEFAFLILEDAIRTTISSLPQQALEIIDAIEQSGKQDLTTKEIGNLVGRQRVTVSKYLPKLVEGGLLSCDDSRKPYKYNLLGSNPGTNFFSSLKQKLDPFGLNEFKKFLEPLVSVSLEEIEEIYSKWMIEQTEPTIFYDLARGEFVVAPGPDLFPGETMETTESKQMASPILQNKLDICFENKKKQVLDKLFGEPEVKSSSNISEIKKPTVAELIEELRHQFKRGTQEQFVDLAAKLGGLSPEEAQSLLQRLLDDGEVAFDPEGWLIWT